MKDQGPSLVLQEFISKNFRDDVALLNNEAINQIM